MNVPNHMNSRKRLVWMLTLLTVWGLPNCSTKPIKTTNLAEPNQAFQDSIVDQYLKNGAWKHSLYSQAWQDEIDKGLAVDSTIGQLWQQKAMPLFKQGKYELGSAYLNKAVKFDRKTWQDYRAFMKCIFSKSYSEAIVDFEDCINRFGNQYVMDHSYSFYIALSNIQLNNFKKAQELLEKEILRQETEQGQDWVHYLDLFYLGICYYEQGVYEKAIASFDRSISIYPQFSDALYYKAYSLVNLEKKEEAQMVFDQAKEYAMLGYSINEDNAIYERYPYQIRWKNILK